MAWNVETSNSSFNASEYTTKTINERNSVRSTRQTTDGMGEYSIVGINANQVPAMKNAIANYVEAIQNHLEKIETSADSSQAFKSDAVKTAVQNYLLTLKDYCQNLVSQMLAFSDKLQEVYEKWVEATGNMAQSVNSSASGFNKGTRYTQQK